MFAVLKTGGKQYKVSQNDVIIVEKLSADAGDLVQFNDIMMVGGEKTELGAPTIVGAAVQAEVLEQAKSKKVISFVKRRRKHSSKRTRGHRQSVTVLRIKSILDSGAKVLGEAIEVGVSVIKTESKPIQKPAVKIDVKKKAAAKTDTNKKLASKENDAKKPTVKVTASKEPVVKREASKKSAIKADVAKKPIAKANTAKKAVTAVDKTKKATTKAETTKKSTVKDKSTKRSAVIKKN